ncbi:MAG: MgtC/SapB family protein [Phycisphaerales bacterium]
MTTTPMPLPPVFSFGGMDVVTLIGGRLLLAAALAFILGMTRERLRKTAGLRTHMMVCLGSSIFVLAALLTQQTADGCSRVIQGITQGIGFLGAGTIVQFSDKAEVKGLTTAAGIWLTAGVGVACGLGEFWLAIIATVLAWLVLTPLGIIERRWEDRRDAANAAAADHH